MAMTVIWKRRCVFSEYRNQALVLRLENKSLSCWTRRRFYFCVWVFLVLSLIYFTFIENTDEQ